MLPLLLFLKRVKFCSAVSGLMPSDFKQKAESLGIDGGFVPFCSLEESATVNIIFLAFWTCRADIFLLAYLLNIFICVC